MAPAMASAPPSTSMRAPRCVHALLLLIAACVCLVLAAGARAPGCGLPVAMLLRGCWAKLPHVAKFVTNAILSNQLSSSSELCRAFRSGSSSSRCWWI